ncbi:MAG: HD domain-containing protein [Syntrophales bacterium]|nr:HD domain-containing protein [Syntrophales bacterium]
MTLQTTNDLPKKPNLSGIELLKGIARLIQIAKLYEDNNSLIIDAVKAFKLAVKKSSDHSGHVGHVALQIFNGRFFLQEEKLPLFRKNAQLLNYMLQFLEKRSIYGFNFDADLENIAVTEVLAFVRLLSLADQHDDPPEWLKTELEKSDIHWLVVIQESMLNLRDASLESELGRSDALDRKKELAKETYHYALNSVKEVAEKLLAGKDAGIRQSVRMVQRMVDIITEDDTTFFSLSTIRMYDDYTFTHSLNVALLAMSLGKRIGMKHNTLEQLGLCGLFHDLGKIEIPKQILNKRGKLNDSEFNEIKKHSINSALLILKLKTEKYRKVHLFVSPFEHHIRYDHSGYPSVDKERPISLFGRILTIVDVYDAITSPRIYRPVSMSQDRALCIMLSDSGKYFDPVLLKIFVNMLGVYPIGTVLRLDTGEVGLALLSSPKADQARPNVQLLNRNADKQYTKGKIIDLAERDPRTGDYKRNIIKTEHPAALGIQPASYMI